MIAPRLCRHCGTRHATPRVIQAIPLPSAESRRPVWPTLVVGGFVLGIALLEGLVPVIVSAIR